MQGYIKLYRKILENPIVTKDSDHFAVWCYLLLNASHNNFEVIFEGKKITLNPGQLITGRKSISEVLKINEHKVQRIIKFFESEQQIAQQTTPRNRLITILNWNIYQQDAQQNEQQLHNKRTTTAQQLHTTNNVKKVKNVKKVNNILPENSEFEILEKEDLELKQIVDFYNQTFNKSISSTSGFKSNYLKWQKIHDTEKIKVAISNGRLDKFWSDKLTLTILFRVKNPRGENVDMIEDLANRSTRQDNAVGVKTKIAFS